MNPEDAPDRPEEVVISLQAGDPVAVDGEELGPVELLTLLNEKAGAQGVGRIDIVENRFIGIKSRGVYETPGGTVLHAARRAVESLVLDREVLHLRDALSLRYAEIVYNGFWFSPERFELQATMDHIQERVSGEARLELYRGAVRVTGRRSRHSLYRPELATFEADDGFDQSDATGFINLNKLRIRGHGDGA
jgi:argininosuccinate synthase